MYLSSFLCPGSLLLIIFQLGMLGCIDSCPSHSNRSDDTVPSQDKFESDPQSNYYQRKADKLEEAQGQLASATTAHQLIAIADEFDLVHDEAMRRAGDIYLNDARRSVIDSREEAAKKALAKAGSAYTAIAERGGTVEYQFVGYEGLAKVAVMSSQWDQAAAHYSKIVELAGEAYPAQAARAQIALTRIG